MNLFVAVLQTIFSIDKVTLKRLFCALFKGCFKYGKAEV